MKTSTDLSRADGIQAQLEAWNRLAESHQGVVVGFEIGLNDVVEPVIEFLDDLEMSHFGVPASLFQAYRPHWEESQGHWHPAPAWAVAVQKIRDFGGAAHWAETQARMSRHEDERAFWAEVWDAFMEFVGRVVKAIGDAVGLKNQSEEQHRQTLESIKRVKDTPRFESTKQLSKLFKSLGFEVSKVKERLHGKKELELIFKVGIGANQWDVSTTMPLNWVWVPME